jgi:epoxyqueuosine reductase
VLRARLVRLGRWLQAERPEAGWKVCVDTAPVLEREWAARAGLGWIGKSTSLLNRRLGSELFLGVLLSTLALEPDEPVRDHCGRCTACLDACPTAAFLEPRVLDARRCVAYLTIEHRGPVPEEPRPAMGMMVAGCDICQEVCPWTRRAPADLHPEFAPAPHRYRPALAAMDALDEDGFRLWRQASALSRIPFAQLRQSLAVARANLERGGGVTSAASERSGALLLGRPQHHRQVPTFQLLRGLTLHLGGVFEALVHPTEQLVAVLRAPHLAHPEHDGNLERACPGRGTRGRGASWSRSRGC